ncbi:MAG: sulfatase-like hydrolase/transferase, partial [Candidatus Binatia bacterium]
ATMMTGLEPISHGVHANGRFRVPAKLNTLAEHLRGAGYRTGAFVSAMVLNSRYKLDQGFEVYDDEVQQRSGALDFNVPSRSGEEMTDAAIAWLEKLDGDRPFFLWVHYYDPHQPNLPKPAPFDKIRDRYAAEIAYADAHLGRVLQAVKRIEGERGTLTVFTADHGESLGEHGEMTHGILAYDSTLHVPLILAGRGVERGRRRTALARHADLVPTVLSATGLSVPRELPGRNLLALSAADDDEDAVVGYFESQGSVDELGWNGIGGVRTGRWKYTGEPAPVELFDTDADPQELRNLAEIEPAVRERMEGVWGDFLAAAPKPAKGAELAKMSLKTQEQLAALGYIQAPQRYEEGETPPDPRKFIGVHTWVDQSRTLANKGRYEQAISVLETLRESRSIRALVLRTLAPVYGARGRYDDAVRAYREYIDLTGAQEARVGLARVLLTADRATEALAALDEVAEARAATLVTLRAYTLSRLGRREEAHKLVDEEYASPREAPGRTRLHAALVIDAAPVPDGEQRLRALVAERPRDAVLRSKLGYYLAVWGGKERAEEGVELLRAAVKERPRDADLFANLGWGAYHAGRYEEAIENLEGALLLDDNRSLERLRLASALKGAGKIQQAAISARDALRRQPGAAWAGDARALLAELERELGKANGDGKGAKRAGTKRQESASLGG